MNRFKLAGPDHRCTRRSALAGLAALASPAHALMAGATPDSPAARVDTNLPGSPWTSAVSVLVGGTPFSGVAIARQYVLTAAHVAGGQPPSQVQVVVNSQAAPVTMSVAAVATYPGTVFPYDDLCVLQLAQPLPAGVPIPPIMDTPQPTGTVLTLVGYGASGYGNVGPSVGASSTVKRSGRNVLDTLTDRLDSSGRTGQFFVYDFDGPSGNGAMGGPTLGNAVETAPASGDSGSPVYVDSTAGIALYGLTTLVLSFASGSTTSVFGSGGGGLVLSYAPHLSWLQTQTAHTLTLASQVVTADVPVAPTWALGLLAAGFATHLLRVGRG